MYIYMYKYNVYKYMYNIYIYIIIMYIYTYILCIYIYIHIYTQYINYNDFTEQSLEMIVFMQRENLPKMAELLRVGKSY